MSRTEIKQDSKLVKNPRNAGRKTTKEKQLEFLYSEADDIRVHPARLGHNLSYMARIFVQTSLPHSKCAPGTNEFVRTNGNFSLSIIAPSRIGIPYGKYPRLILNWISEEVKLKKDRRLTMGDSLTSFMRAINIDHVSGGKNGTITGLQDQMKRLFSSSISTSAEMDNVSGEAGMRIADGHTTWWEPRSPDQLSLYESEVYLSERFFQEVQNCVPVDIRALRALSHSPLSLDIYCWVTWRAFSLTNPLHIKWTQLESQFGSNYKDTKDFRKNFLKRLAEVKIVYPQLRTDERRGLFILYPSPPHVPKEPVEKVIS